MMSKIILFLVALCAECLSQSERGYSQDIPRQYNRPTYYSDVPRQPPRRPFYDDISFFSEGDVNRVSSPVQTLYSWKQLDFTFPDNSIREQMITNQQFIPINALILDLEVYDEAQEPVVFVTVPRVRPGIPVTLATVSRQRKNGEFLLEPFPNWESHIRLFEGNCEDTISSVFRVHIDECGRLWVLDSGSLNAFNGNAVIGCQPKLWLYDLRSNNQLIGKFPIPQSMIANNSLLVTIVADIRRGQCNDAFVYIADAIAYKMIVFNLRNQQFWRINSIQFFPFPDQSTFNVNGETFDLFGGIFGLALGPVFNGDQRILYFNSIDSVKQAWVDTADLRNQDLWRDNMDAKPRAFNLLNGTRPSQSTATAMSGQGIMYFGLVSSNELACWNIQTEFGDENIVRLARDDVALQFVSGVKLSKNNLYAVTNRLQKYQNRNVNENEVNYRVLVGDLEQLTQGTKCQVDNLNNRFYPAYSSGAKRVYENRDLLGLQDF